MSTSHDRCYGHHCSFAWPKSFPLLYFPMTILYGGFFFWMTDCGLISTSLLRPYTLSFPLLLGGRMFIDKNDTHEASGLS